MIDPNIGNKNTPNSKMPESVKPAPSGLAGRLVAAAVVLACFFAVAVYWYRNVSTAEADTQILDPIVISETPVANVSELPVPFSSITSCIDQNIIDGAEHPLIPLLEMANHGMDVMRQDVVDYTAIITKRVRWKGKLQPEGKLFCKIRHSSCREDSEESIPFSVYTRFITPKPGQEAIWVQGCHEDKLIAHGPTGLLNLMTLHLDPEGSMAMNGNRYPIQNIGMLNLIKKMIEKGENDLQYDDCEVKLTRNVMIGNARCTRLEIIHQHYAKHFEFHRAEIYIDDDRNLPIAFRSYLWPDSPDGQPKLLERYYYTDIKVNVGLVDADFDPANPDYHFPGM